ncbi:MAG: hypothetical protein JW913_02965 [Chitinispirillaceae bacterium]|nr:hypothetical protein [Chitinispirillaceae bacterium]
MGKYTLFAAVLAIGLGIPRAQTGSIKVGSTTRTFIVYAPSGLPDNPALVVCMHGLGGSGSQQRSYSGFDKVADKGKFIVVYPDGIDKSVGSAGWDITGNSDVDFITTLIDNVAGRYNIDRNRVYASGFSMGGMMSHKLACDVPEKIAAIGTASGYPLYGNNNCSPPIPVPICHTHGTADDVVPYSGLEAWIAKFVKADGCPETPATTNPTSKYKREYWGPCKDGSEIVVYHFDGMSHGYVNTSRYSFSASDTFWTFFEKHPRNGAVGIYGPVSGARTTSAFSTAYSAGAIHLKSGLPVRSVRVFDVRGRTVFSWKAGNVPVHDVAFPASRPAGGIYLVNIRGAAGNNGIVRLLVP